MVNYTRTKEVPKSLAIEKGKKTGSYNKSDVIDALNKVFYGKCYICENSKSTSINVEHLHQHKGNKNLMFDWNNLFLSCGHCNNVKLGKYDNILDCTAEDVENCMECIIDSNENLKSFVKVNKLVSNNIKLDNTIDLLIAVYNGDYTPIKKLESANLRALINEEVLRFRSLINKYNQNKKLKKNTKITEKKILGELNRGTPFVAFKRYIAKTETALAFSNGIIFVLTGPSGAGKTTNWWEICKRRQDTAKPSIVHTTRAKRDGEMEGDQYYFVDDDTFSQMAGSGEFSCYTTFCDKEYGLSKRHVKKVIEEDNQDMIFDSIIPVPDVKSIAPNVVVIYLTTSTDEELERRIISRANGNIAQEEVARRMQDARQQRREVAPICDYIVKTDGVRNKEEITNELMYIMDEVKREYQENGNIYPEQLQKFTPSVVLPNNTEVGTLEE